MANQHKLKYYRIRALILSSVAIILEWYDFLVFGFYAVFISKLFFPFKDETTSLVTTFIVFGVSFFFRPIGAVVMSQIGDKLGRKRAFIITVILMTLPTFLIGILPTYEHIGITATVLIIILRIMQGFSLGGERSSTLSILVEMAPKNLRGTYVVFAGTSTMAGIILASAVCGIVSNIFSPDEMTKFGWRIPFLLGIVTGLVAYMLRKYLNESEKFLEIKSAHQISQKPITETITYHWRNIIITFFGTMAFSVGFYVIFVYLITFSVTTGGMQLPDILKMNTINMVIITLLIPFFGYISDKVGRKPLMIVGSLSTAAISVYAFKVFAGDDYTAKFIFQLAVGLTMVIYAAGMFPFLVEIFPTRIRMTSISLGHVLGFAIFGGSAPVVVSYLLGATGNVLSPGIYLAITAIISFVSIIWVKETYRSELE